MSWMIGKPDIERQGFRAANWANDRRPSQHKQIAKRCNYKAAVAT